MMSLKQLFFSRWTFKNCSLCPRMETIVCTQTLRTARGSHLKYIYQHDLTLPPDTTHQSPISIPFWVFGFNHGFNTNYMIELENTEISYKMQRNVECMTDFYISCLCCAYQTQSMHTSLHTKQFVGDSAWQHRQPILVVERITWSFGSRLWVFMEKLARTSISF